METVLPSKWKTKFMNNIVYYGIAHGKQKIKENN